DAQRRDVVPRDPHVRPLPVARSPHVDFQRGRRPDAPEPVVLESEATVTTADRRSSEPASAERAAKRRDDDRGNHAPADALDFPHALLERHILDDLKRQTLLRRVHLNALDAAFVPREWRRVAGREQESYRRAQGATRPVIVTGRFTRRAESG